MRAHPYSLAVILLACICSVAGGEPVGRLFSTPAERAALDRMRLRGEKSGPVNDQPPPEKPAIPLEPEREQITLDGFVRRSSGKSTTWINQLPQNENEISHEVTVRQKLSRPPSISILLSSGKRVNLKAGQTFDKVSGKVSEVYEPVPAVQTPPEVPPPDLENK